MIGTSEDSMRNKEYNLCWTEVKNGKSKAGRKQHNRYVIPVINNTDH
jgi:hypothetical protein